MPSRIQLAAIAVLVLLILLTTACIADDTTNLPTWKPDPKIVAGLGQEIDIDGAAFKVPQTVTLSESRTLDHIRILKWRGDPESDGIRPLYMLIEQSRDTLSDTDKHDPNLNSTNVVRMFSGLTANLISDETSSPVQHGWVARLPFTRQYFKGYNHRWLKTVHGFFYSTITDRAIYFFEVWDQEPISKYSLPVYEQSVLSFHRTDQPNSVFPENLIDPEDAKEQQDQSE